MPKVLQELGLRNVLNIICDQIESQDEWGSLPGIP